MPEKKLGKVSESPTIPGKTGIKRKFDIASFYESPAPAAGENKGDASGLDEKLRKAYYWIANYAIINPFCDIEFSIDPPREFRIGGNKNRIILPTDQSFASFVLLPLLALATRRKVLLVGGPGRGKTSSAILMGLLAGYSIKEVKRSVQHGQPQMTISDLLGNPLPSDMVKAESMEGIRIAWRKWLSMRVKIIDEYNRIPTRTQSALLGVMSENYAELLDQVYECPEAAWYLTANDDAGGGTYQVIEALRDRIDVVVKALHFNTRFLGELLDRVERGIKPEEYVPTEIVFTEIELDKVNEEILRVSLPRKLRRRVEYFASQFELAESGGEQLEYKTKDSIRVAGLDFSQVARSESSKDQLSDIGYQTKNGISVRAFMTSLVFIKAIAYFRGNAEATYEDALAILPFVLHDKLVQNQECPFFEQPENNVYRTDRISWIRKLFTLSCAEYDKLGLDKTDPVGKLLETFEAGFRGVTEEQAKAAMVSIERILEDISSGKKLYGPLFDDVLALKYLHQRYSNYLKWVELR